MSETVQTGHTEKVPGIPDFIQSSGSDVMHVSDQMILLTWLAFGIAALCLHKLLWKPILRAVESREQAIGEALEGADRARQEIADTEARGREIIDKADDAARGASEQAAREAVALLARADREAKLLARRRLEDAEREIEAEQATAAEAVRLDAAKRLGEMLELFLRNNLTPEQKRAYQADILNEVKL